MRLIRIRSGDMINFLRAKRLGWLTLWTGEGIICMYKPTKRGLAIEINIEPELSLAVNMLGPMSETIKDRLREFFEHPCRDTWDDISSIILNETSLTVWQAVIAVDSSFPKTGPHTSPKGIILKDWERVPDPETVKEALIYATH